MILFALNVALWALLTIALLCFGENYYSPTNQKKAQLAKELGAGADLKAIGYPDNVVSLTEDSFYKHVSSGKHLVMFYSSWCPNGYRMVPTWSNMAQKLGQEPGVTLSKIDCTKYPGPCQAFEARGYPMVLWIEDGMKIEMYGGDRPLPQMLDFVKKFFGHDEPPKYTL